jgi:glutathione S-transferase
VRLIGRLDSPFVRRVAVSLDLMGVDFRQEPVSVFRDYERFAEINPVVRAPTLVTDDGVVLMDSTLILAHVEALLPEARRLSQVVLSDHARATRITGLALAACDKTVQLAYEFNLRPPERRHDPWIERVRPQLRSAYALLEAEFAGVEGWLFGKAPTQADVAAAVAWSFTQMMLPGDAPAEDHPRLAQFAARAEATEAFVRWPRTEPVAAAEARP